MTNEQILRTAMVQSAVDLGCAPEDFLENQSLAVLSRPHPQARRYLTLPFSCNLVSYGNNVVASVSPQLREPVERYIRRFPAEHCFETPNLHVLSKILQPYGEKLCFMAEYFLPDISVLSPHSCSYETRLLTQQDFAALYLPQ